jgi:TPR repeat protein
MLYKGHGLVQDFVEAMKWFRLSAAKGFARAQFRIGLMYDKGVGVLQDYAEAVKWYRLAAAQGEASAQVNLGAMYDTGQGVLQDYIKAHALFNLAATKGNATAAKNRDIVAKRMTPQQIADAQKLARDCSARNFKGCD